MSNQNMQNVSARVIGILALLFAGASFGQIEDCATEVRIDGPLIAVAPTNVFDGDNIRCAMEAARDAGFPTVKLDPGTFTIAHISIDSFTGTLEGTTIATTTVVFDDDSIDCEAMINDGLTPSGIKFTRGEPRVRFMTVVAGDPCSTDRPFYMLHFTGRNANGPCGNDVVFGNVDRVSLEATISPDPFLVGVGVFPEGLALGGCKTTLLGTFKLNRSLITDVPFGARTNIKGSGQVDINFNEFSGNDRAILIDNANQITSVQGNDFFGSATASDDYASIELITDDPAAPASNRLVVHSNFFDIVGAGPSAIAVGVVMYQDNRFANVSTVITDNVFDAVAPGGGSILVEDISGGLISGNTFRGNNLSSLALVDDDRQVADWAIVGNNFSQAAGAAGDIFLDENTTRIIVGPQQGALIADNGVGNTIILGADELTKSTQRSSNEPADIAKAKSNLRSRLAVNR